jgi:hypothetical protein
MSGLSGTGRCFKMPGSTLTSAPIWIILCPCDFTDYRSHAFCFLILATIFYYSAPIVGSLRPRFKASTSPRYQSTNPVEPNIPESSDVREHVHSNSYQYGPRLRHYLAKRWASRERIWGQSCRTMSL